MPSIDRAISGRLPAVVRSVLDDVVVRARSFHGTTFGEAFDDALMYSVKRDSNGHILGLIGESRAARDSLSPGSTDEVARLGRAARAVVDWAEVSGRPLDGIALGRTVAEWAAARTAGGLLGSQARIVERGAVAAFEGALDGAYWYDGLSGTHHLGRIYLTPRVTDVLVAGAAGRQVPVDDAYRAAHIIEHELGHVRNFRSARPMAAGPDAEALVEMRARTSPGNVDELLTRLDLPTGGRVAVDPVYTPEVDVMRGYLERAGISGNDDIRRFLDAHPDHEVRAELARRILQHRGLDPAWQAEAEWALAVPYRSDDGEGLAARTLARFDAMLDATPRVKPAAIARRAAA